MYICAGPLNPDSSLQVLWETSPPIAALPLPTVMRESKPPWFTYVSWISSPFLIPRYSRLLLRTTIFHLPGELASQAGCDGKEMLALYAEYELGISPEAQAVKDLDRLDMALQAHEYELCMSAPGQLATFFSGGLLDKIRHPVLQSVSPPPPLPRFGYS